MRRLLVLLCALVALVGLAPLGAVGQEATPEPDCRGPARIRATSFPTDRMA